MLEFWYTNQPETKKSIAMYDALHVKPWAEKSNDDIFQKVL